jgi:hypothetical protein
VRLEDLAGTPDVSDWDYNDTTWSISIQTHAPNPVVEDDSASEAFAWVQDLLNSITNTAVIEEGEDAEGMAATPPPLYDNGTGPDWTKAKQGDLGNCWFVSAVIGLARTNPDAITNMIQDHGDGTYTVTFPGQQPVTITYDNDPNAKGGSSDGIWLRVLEQAGAKLLADTQPLVSFLVDNFGHRGRFGIYLVTGANAGPYFKWFYSISSWRDAIRTAMANNKIVTASTGTGGLSDRINGLVSRHVYLVIGYDAETDKVRLLNPWRKDGEFGQTKPNPDDEDTPDKKNDGIFEMTMQEFRDNFLIIDVQP